jgi:hypothetical protein
LARAGDLGQGEVATDGHVPRHVDQAGDVAEVAPRLRNAAGQQLAQREGLERGDCYALPVDGVERAHGVAGDQQLLREAAADAGREPDRDRVVQRLGPLQRFVDVGEDQGGGEGLQPGGSIGGWSPRMPDRVRMYRSPSMAAGTPPRGTLGVAPVTTPLSAPSAPGRSR